MLDGCRGGRGGRSEKEEREGRWGRWGWGGWEGSSIHTATEQQLSALHFISQIIKDD
jgi:hypothetical protein